MLDKQQCREWIIRKPLQDAGLYSQSAENLLMGIMGVETHWYSYCVQEGPHPAGFGAFQFQEQTYEDVWAYCVHTGLAPKLLAASGMTPSIVMPDISILIYNLRFSALMCRMFFARFKECLPEPDDYEGMAHLHKKLYNTSGGGTDLDKSILIFKEVCA
jgi:hypothetical protein